ncbi:MAG: hypothetical protein Q4G02_03395 [bacterium]|nr:hypothetical protein [bacterium]
MEESEMSKARTTVVGSCWDDEEVEDPWMKHIRLVNRWKRIGKVVLTVILISLFFFLLMTQSDDRVANAEAATQLIPENSLVFLQLQSLREDGDNEVLCLYLKAGAVYTSAAAERILQIVDLDDVDDQTTLPAYDKFKRQNKVIDLDKFVKKLDRNAVALKKVEEAGQYLWDLSENLNSWLDGKYQDWGIYDKLEDWGVSDALRKLFGRD